MFLAGLILVLRSDAPLPNSRVEREESPFTGSSEQRFSFFTKNKLKKRVQAVTQRMQ